MKLTIFSLLFLGVLSATAANMEPDLVLKVNAQSDMKAAARVTYIATKDSFSCKDYVFDELNLKQVREQLNRVLDAVDGVIRIPFAIDDSCSSERLSIRLAVSGNGIESENVVNVFVGGGDLQTQNVECERVLSGPKRDTPALRCSGDIRTTDSGEANIEVLVK